MIDSTSLARWSLVALLVACSGGESSTRTVAPEEAVQEEEPPPPPPAEAEGSSLVPSPTEMQETLSKAGIDQSLSELVTDRTLKTEGSDKRQVALRTGVVLADMLLTVKKSTNEVLIGQLDRIKTGMKQLDSGGDIAATIDDIKTRVKSEAVTRDELLVELDELSGVVIPELEFNGVEWVVPLISAGSWLEGSHLVARALQKAEDHQEAATKLLKVPQVVEYFQKYVETEAEASAAVELQLKSTLGTLHGLATKPEPLASEDLKTVERVTNDLLSAL